ncbi:MAG: hypothetical protein EXR63_00445 [Dehalococcoidia bacterium]|nr:hypothetical protein [Dehalococcoidia bacterium]
MPYDLAVLRRRAANVSPRELRGAALERGWVERASTSSHSQFMKPGRRTLVIPKHLGRRVALNIIRDLELGEDEGDD